MDYKQLEILFKTLGDETRLRIVELLKGGELCGCKILEHFDITQPTLSYHMKLLCESGLVRGVRDGAWMRYTLNCAMFKHAETYFRNCNEAAQNRDGDCDCEE